MAKLSKAAVSSLLAVVAAATASPPVFAYLTDKQAKPLAEFKAEGSAEVTPLIEVNKAMIDPNDKSKFATRPTALGIAEAAKLQNAPQQQPDAPKPTFAIETGVPLTVVKRGGGTGGSTYPFDQLTAPTGEGDAKAYASFFVPATTERPNPAKALASTVSSATKRYKAEGRKFAIRNVDETAQGRGKGARIYRTA